MIRNYLKNLLPYKPIKVINKKWDENYINGHWNRLREVKELARYSIINGYIQFFKQNINILDVGCGEGILCERLSKSNCSSYVGIDLSTIAIGKAIQNNKNEKVKFYVSTIKGFKTNEKFDAIIFNESLYYLKDPKKILHLYENFLKEEGIYIISMEKTKNTEKIWKKLNNYYSIIDSIVLTNQEDVSWTIKVLSK